jgi:hypothetical protein
MQDRLRDIYVGSGLPVETEKRETEGEMQAMKSVSI